MPLGSWPPDPIWLPPSDMAKMNEGQSPTGWWCTQTSPPQIVPTQDLKPHVFGTGCWCNPVDDHEFVRHNAADGRERYQLQGARPN